MQKAKQTDVQSEMLKVLFPSFLCLLREGDVRRGSTVPKMPEDIAYVARFSGSIISLRVLSFSVNLCPDSEESYTQLRF